MNKLLMTIGLAGVLSTPALQATYVQLTDGPGNTGGGEFNAFLNGSSSSFITFFLEKTEYIGFGTKYNVDFSDGASSGGKDSDGNSDNKKDIIKQGTAYLYSSMLDGTLSGSGWTRLVGNKRSTSL